MPWVIHTVAGNRLQRRDPKESRKLEKNPAEFPFADASELGGYGLVSLLMTSIPSAFTSVTTPKLLPRAFERSGTLHMNPMDVAETSRGVSYVDSLEEFGQAISSPRLTVVGFSQTLCGACSSAEAMFQKMSEEYQGVDFYKAVGDDRPMKAVMMWQGVKIVPSFGVYRNGQKIALISGKNREAGLREAVEAQCDLEGCLA